MFRATALAIAVFAFARVAGADCDASHGAQRAVTDDQAKASQPAATKTAQRAVKQKTVACEGSNCTDKSKQTAQSAVALAHSASPAVDGPSH